MAALLDSIDLEVPSHHQNYNEIFLKPQPMNELKYMTHKHTQISMAPVQG